MQPRILLVEDEADLLDMICEALLASDYDVVCTSSGREALDRLAAGETFDFVVSDIAMPGGISGIDIAQAAASLRLDTRLILASGHQRAHLPPLPDNVTFLQKPYRFTQLLGMLQSA